MSVISHCSPPVHTDLSFVVNGRSVLVSASPAERLSRVLREKLGLTGTKVGCDAGDCGACTVLLDGQPVCSCLVSFAQAEGHEITTVEGLPGRAPLFGRLQNSFLHHGAAQCGICTPGMLIAATALLERNHSPAENEAMDAIGGVLCRCTGYRKIITAILEVGSTEPATDSPIGGEAVGKRLIRLDGKRKVEGTEIFGADQAGAPPGGAHAGPAEASALPSNVVLARAGEFFGWLIGFVVIASLIGFVPAIGVFVFVFMGLGFKEPLLRAAVFGVAMTAFCYAVFDRGLSVPWPQAVLGDFVPQLRDWTSLL